MIQSNGQLYRSDWSPGEKANNIDLGLGNRDMVVETLTSVGVHGFPNREIKRTPREFSR